MPTLIVPDPPARYFANQEKANRQRNTTKRYVATSVRQAIERVFTGLGGWEAMMDWARTNPDLFYGSVIPKLLPAELAQQSQAGKITVVINTNPTPAEPRQTCGELVETISSDEPLDTSQ